jgi:hypothetical protein
MHPLILTRVLGRVDPGVEFQDAILLVSCSPLRVSKLPRTWNTRVFFPIGLRPTWRPISRLSCHYQFPRIVSIITKAVVRRRSFGEGDVCEGVEKGGCIGARCV